MLSQLTNAFLNLDIWDGCHSHRLPKVLVHATAYQLRLLYNAVTSVRPPISRSLGAYLHPASAADVIIRDIKAEVVEPASFVCEAAHLSPS